MSREQSPPSREVLVALNRAATSARLMAGAVHEVNNALQVIAGSVELLEDQPALPPAILKSLDRIRRQTERAAGALMELQAFTKASLDGRQRFNLRESVSQAISLRRYAVTRLGLKIEFRSDPDAVALVNGNPGYVQQAVINLLVNAEQAMAGTAGAIVVSLRAEAERVGVEVTDAGPGVSDAARALLFEPFVSTKEPSEGTGLGLWATRSIVESLGGSIEVVSPPLAADGATGTSVVLWLPRG